MNNQYMLYTLSDPRLPDNIRYIGVTRTSLSKRLTQHTSDAKCRINDHRHLFNFIRKLLVDNIKPEIALLEEYTEQTWEFSEIYWINQFRTWGYDLVNTAIGGRLGGVKKHSEATKNKIKEALNNKPKEWHEWRTNKIVESRIGSKHSEETKEKMRKNNKKTMLGKTHTDDVKEKLRKANIGKKYSEETKQKLSLMRNGKKLSPTHIQQIILNHTGRKMVIQYDKISGTIINKFESITIASKTTGINESCISECCNNKQKTAGKCVWRFANK